MLLHVRGTMRKESSFKQGLKVIPLYIVTVVIGTVVCAVAYSLYSLCTHMVAGAQVKIFNLNYFLEGVFIFSPAILILSGLLTCAYLIRHPPASAFPTIIYMIILSLQIHILFHTERQVYLRSSCPMVFSVSHPMETYIITPTSQTRILLTVPA